MTAPRIPLFERARRYGVMAPEEGSTEPPVPAPGQGLGRLLEKYGILDDLRMSDALKEATAPALAVPRAIERSRNAPRPDVAAWRQPLQEFKGAFRNSLVEGNIGAVGETLEALDYEGLGGRLRAIGEGGTHNPRVGGLREIRRDEGAGNFVLDALNFGGSMLGQGVGSIAMPIAGGVAGGLVAGPPGAAAGAFAGGYPLGVSEQRRGLRAAGVEGDAADDLSLLGGIPMAALERLVPGRVAGRILNPGSARAATRHVAGAALHDAGQEGLTEMLQDAFVKATVASQTATPESIRGITMGDVGNTALDLVESGLAGALTGGFVGGGSAALQVARTPSVSAEDRLRSALLAEPPQLPDVPVVPDVAPPPPAVEPTIVLPGQPAAPAAPVTPPQAAPVAPEPEIVLPAPPPDPGQVEMERAAEEERQAEAQRAVEQQQKEEQRAAEREAKAEQRAAEREQDAEERRRIEAEKLASRERVEAEKLASRERIEAAKLEQQAAERAAAAPEPEQGRSYQEVQAEIDALENRLGAEGVDLTQMYDAATSGTEVLGQAGWTPMPPELSRLYQERDGIGQREDTAEIDAFVAALPSGGPASAEQVRSAVERAFQHGRFYQREGKSLDKTAVESILRGIYTDLSHALVREGKLNAAFAGDLDGALHESQNWASSPFRGGPSPAPLLEQVGAIMRQAFGDQADGLLVQIPGERRSVTPAPQLTAPNAPASPEAESPETVPAPASSGSVTQTTIAEEGSGASGDEVGRLVAEAERAIRSESLPDGSRELRAWAANILGRPYESGTWKMDDAYDAIEGAVNRIAREAVAPARPDQNPSVPTSLRAIRQVEETYFKGRLRSSGMLARQQFSTPLQISWAAQYAAGVTQGEKVQEPTAGTGNLVNFLGDGVQVDVNELDPRRAAVLTSLGHSPTSENALMLPAGGKRYNAVITNPPYGSSTRGKRYTGFNATPFPAGDVSQRFLYSALQSLVDGGRLVAVLPPNTMAANSSHFRRWLAENHTPVAYIESPAGAYDGRGTNIGTVLLVADKGRTGDAAPEPFVLRNPTWEQWEAAIGQFAPGQPLHRATAHEPAHDAPAVRTARPSVSTGPKPVAELIDRNRPTEEEVRDDGATTKPDTGRDPAVAAGPTGEPADGSGGTRADGGRPVDSVEREGEPGGREPAGPAGSPGLVAAEASGLPGRAEADRGGADAVVPPVPERPAKPRARRPQSLDAERAAADNSPVFVPYAVHGERTGSAHPRLVVETRSMAGMPSPAPAGKLRSRAVNEAWGRDGAEGGLSNEQADAVVRMVSAWEKGHGLLVADDVGVGKSREIAASALEAIERGAKRILVTTKNQNNVLDLMREFALVATGEAGGQFPATFVLVGDYKGVKSGKESLPTPKGPVVYFAHSYNFADYAKALGEVNVDAWLADEAHEFKNQFSKRGESWRALHADVLGRTSRVGYFTATPAVTLDELGYLYGLREWAPGGFSDWVEVKLGKRRPDAEGVDGQAASAAVTAQASEDIRLGEGAATLAEDDTAIKGGKKPFMRKGRADVFSSLVTPAETEQVMRELKGSGKYIARDLWRGGVEFGVQTVDLLGDGAEARSARERYDKVAELVRDISRAARRFGKMNAKVKTSGAERALTQSYMKQLLFDMRLDTVLREADASLAAGRQVVISVHSVAGDGAVEEGIVGADSEVPLNKRLEAAINRINVDEVVKDGRGEGAEFVELGEIPEALAVRAELLSRLADLTPLRDPVRTIEDHFGAKQVAVITGQKSPRQRKQSMGEFQSGQRSVALISKAGKTGISLHDVNGKQRHMIVADYEWSADTFKQELGRVDRTGQKSSPVVTLVASNMAGERKFAATIAARMASLGATSKGSAEATGTGVLDQFDVSGGVALTAMREAYESLPKNIRDLFTSSKFVEMVSVGSNQWEFRSKRRPDGAHMKDFLLDLMMLPVEASDQAMSAWVEVRDSLMTDEAQAAQSARRTGALTGEVLRSTVLTAPGDPELTLVEVKTDSGKSGILQGFVTPYIADIQDARGRSEHGEPKSRRYVRFTAEDGTLVAGLEVTAGEARRVREAFGKGERKTVTPEEALADLAAGDDVAVSGPRGAPWVLHPRRDGRIQIQKATVAQHRDALKGLPVRYETVGNYLYLSGDEAHTQQFLERFPPRIPEAPSPAQGKKPSSATLPEPAPARTPDENTDRLRPGYGSGTTRGSIFGLDIVAEKVADAIRQARANRRHVETAVIESVSPEVEAAMTGAEGLPKGQAREVVRGIYRAFRRHFQHLDPNSSAMMAEVVDVLRVLEAAPEWARVSAAGLILDTTKGLDKAQVRLMTRVLVTDDLQRDVERGVYGEIDPETGETQMPLPFGLTVDVLEADHARYTAAAKADPKVQAALEKRRALAQAVTRALVDRNLLPAEVLDDSRYFHRQVIHHWQDRQARGLGTSPKDVRVHRKGFQRKRVGSGSDYNTSYVESEYEWLAQAYSLIATKDALARIKVLADVRPGLERQAKRANLEAFYDSLGLDMGKIESVRQVPARKRSTQAKEVLANDPLEPYRRRIARGLGGIRAAANAGTLEAGPYQHVAQALANGPADAHPQFMALLSWIAGQEDHDQSMNARMVFKAIVEREQTIREELGSKYQTWEDLVPDGYSEWQPEQGNHFYVAASRADRTLEGVVEGETEHEVRSAPKETWVIPSELAATMDEFRPYHRDQVDDAWRAVQSTWKQWTLINPSRWARYNLNNFSGDLDILLAYDPTALKHFGGAVRDLWDWKTGKASPAVVREMLELVRLGALNSGFEAVEIPDLHKVGAFRGLTGKGDSMTREGARKVWSALRESTNYRENLLRLVAYRHIRAQLAAGKDVVGASTPGQVRALKNLDERAAKISRELIGDYGNLSVAGQWIRARLVPFYSWLEINAPRYVRLIRNSYREGDAAGVGRGVAMVSLAGGKKVAVTVLQANLIYAAAAAWNASWRAMFGDDEEDDLRDMGRNAHLILGRTVDGRIRTLRLEGALADALDWFKLGDWPADLKDLSRGDQSVGDIVADMAKAPIERVLQGWEPVSKTVFETTTGRSIFPRVWESGATLKSAPRPLRDRAENVAGTLSLQWLYRRVTGRPKPPGSNNPANMALSLFTYTTDPGQAAYWEIRHKARKWVMEQGRGSSGGDPTDRSTALAYYRQAVQWGDERAARRWYARYEELGGSRKGLSQSIRMNAPLGGLSEVDRFRFRRSLSDHDRRALESAEQWYRRNIRPARRRPARKPPKPKLTLPSFLPITPPAA